ncbi:hypothetical protein HY624_02795 [Candidatus Uhrbacteria bacterium]|nr:hypothetical protein [Candidatus Uhrbacteria bacterium]
MRHGPWKEIVKKISDGVLSTASDLLLLHMFLLLEGMSGGFGHRAIRQTFNRAWLDLESFHYTIPETAVKQLTLRGWMKRTQRDVRAWRITAAGRQRIAALFPSYKTHRPWDGKMYLITYDVPERARHHRDILREELRKLGCGMIQASVWMTPYYPRKILREIVDAHNIPGSILVSDLGKNGSIGEQTLEALIRDIYKLDELEQEYAKFIHNCTSGFYRHPITVHCALTNILEHDPQLPFALLPKPWIGNTAYEQYISTRHKLLQAQKTK